jgi:hypothetical protein
VVQWAEKVAASNGFFQGGLERGGSNRRVAGARGLGERGISFSLSLFPFSFSLLYFLSLFPFSFSLLFLQPRCPGQTTTPHSCSSAKRNCRPNRRSTSEEGLLLG